MAVTVQVAVRVDGLVGMARTVLSLPRMDDRIPLPHERLHAYQAACELLRAVAGAQIADLKLRDQAMRAAKSACLNIAEAVGRTAGGDRRRVYAIARGEACEAIAAVQIATMAGECTQDSLEAAQTAAGKTYALLTGLMRVGSS